MQLWQSHWISLSDQTYFTITGTPGSPWAICKLCAFRLSVTRCRQGIVSWSETRVWRGLGLQPLRRKLHQAAANALILWQSGKYHEGCQCLEHVLDFVYVVTVDCDCCCCIYSAVTGQEALFAGQMFKRHMNDYRSLRLKIIQEKRWSKWFLHDGWAGWPHLVCGGKGYGLEIT